jgi:hypothetical protein
MWLWQRGRTFCVLPCEAFQGLSALMWESDAGKMTPEHLGCLADHLLRKARGEPAREPDRFASSAIAREEHAARWR